MLQVTKENKSNTIKASVVICTYNRCTLLADSVSAMVQQDFPVDQYEIIVVDNNSADDTRAVTEALINISPVRIRYILEQQQGLSFARNTGIDNAEGEIVAFVDDDIDAERGWLKAIISAFDDTQVACAGGPIRASWPAQGEKPAWLTNTWVSYLTVSEFKSAKKTGEFVWPDTPWGANISFRKKAFNTVGTFPTNLGRIGSSLLSNEEIIISKKLASAGFRIAFAPDAVIHHKIPSERLTKQYFYHRTYWQGISDAILDTETDASVYEGLRKRTLNFVRDRSKYGANDFTTNCSRRIALGYLYQITYKEKDPVRKNVFNVFRTLSKYLSECRAITNGTENIVPPLPSSPAIKPFTLAGLGVLVVDYEVPLFDKYAGSRTTFMYLQLLVKLGLKVYFLPDNFEGREPYTTTLENLGIKVLHGEWFKNNWQHWILENSEIIQYILFNRPNITIKYIEFIKANTRSIILFQGHDLHYLRLMRKYAVDGDKDSLRDAEEYRNLEFSIIEQSDIILTYSDYEKQIISGHFPNKNVYSVPLFFYERFTEKPFELCDRKNIMFVGSCGHKPNLDAILWFCREIFPKVLIKRPEVVFYIIGTSPPLEVIKLESDNIKVIGHVTDEELEKYYCKVRVVVAPLRFGAGVKGKTIESIYRGVPLIATSNALEGILDIESIIQPFNDAESFAAELIKIYGDYNRLRLISTLYREYTKKYLHIDGAEKTLEKILRSKQTSACLKSQNVISPSTSSARILAFHLPQFHTIPENDEWWGKGFTEWSNVSRAAPHFSGHYQPHVPANLGYYDLNDPSVMRAQAALAKEYGIHGFCFYHYWFNGKLLLETPLHQMLKSGEPDFPFCLCWANEDWTRSWDGRSGEVLIGQRYSDADDIRHFYYLVSFFEDKRYIRVNGKPLFLVYRANKLPDPLHTTGIWRECARKMGIGELYLCRVESFSDEHTDPIEFGFDASVEFQPDWRELENKLGGEDFGDHAVYEYPSVVQKMMAKPNPPYTRFPCVTPSWDNSPRRKSNATIFINSSPDDYERWLKESIRKVQNNTQDTRIVFINAWNEWGEGNYLEPDTKHGLAYLEATRAAITGGSAVQDEVPHMREDSLAVKRSYTASIIIPVFNKVNYTRNCINNIINSTADFYCEVIIIDNGSTDGTKEYLKGLSGDIRIITNDENVGYTVACNQGARVATGRYLVFLNNDTLPQQGWLKHLINTVERDAQAGAVGAKLVYPDGKLQEAGAIVFRDGSALNFGRGDDPANPLYNRACEVDYCSGACLLVPKVVFMELGGFDEMYAPAYYEETDFCFRLREHGYKVIYQPQANIIHYGSVTAGLEPDGPFRKYLAINRTKFIKKWAYQLSSHRSSSAVVIHTADRNLVHDGEGGSISSAGLQITTSVKRLTIGLHAQTLDRQDGFIAGSEITTAGLLKAFLRHPRVEDVKRYGPGNYSSLLSDPLDLLLFEGWDSTIPEVIRRVREGKPQCIILFWNLSFYGFEDVTQLDVDGYCTNSHKTRLLLSKCKPTIYLMLAADPDDFMKTEIVPEYAHEVAYLGLNHPNKSNEVVELMLVEAKNFDLAIFGSGWNEHPTLAPFWKGPLPKGDIAKLYSSAKIVLGTTEDRQRRAGMINNRVFEALACGACFVSEHFPELEAVFGDAILYSHLPGDTVANIKRLLTDREFRNQLETKGRSVILRDHTYAHRIEDILVFYDTLVLSRNGIN